LYAILTLLSVAAIFFILWDAFEAMILPRRVTRVYRPTWLFYRATWSAWRKAALFLPPGKRRQAFLSYFGPLSMFALFTSWFLSLIAAYTVLYWSREIPLQTTDRHTGFLTYLYFSGGNFFTLGYGDVIPQSGIGRGLAVAEAGMGLGMLAVVIGYLPVLYQAFSNREATISLLDARAGSPPSAAQLLLRLAKGQNWNNLESFMAEWERWAGQLLESHLSFPVLSFYRSQHDNQSWLAALTAILDTCALAIAGMKDGPIYQAQLTFAMARHAVVDLALVFKTPPQAGDSGRLAEERWQRLRSMLGQAGYPWREELGVAQRLAELRALYEPFVDGLAAYFLLDLPPILADRTTADNWQTTAWTSRAPGIGGLPLAEPGEHFE
jgi:hypothetical protein